MRKRDHGVLTNATSLLICGLLAGVVVAAAAFPVVAMSGLAAKASADAFDDLPTQLDVVPPPQISYVYAADGKTLLAMLYDENRRNVGIGDIAPVMQQAIVAAEDTRFYEHHGVDMKGVARAMVANHNADGQVSQGASTLTMQYVRQALAYSSRTNEEIVEATEQTPARKLREMKYALALEKKYDKKDILDRYLNISSFGHGAYGIYAASEVYFGKDPRSLTLPEAALLAGLVKAPSSFDPADPDPAKRAAALQRREYVLRQMVNPALHHPAAGRRRQEGHPQHHRPAAAGRLQRRTGPEARHRLLLRLPVPVVAGQPGVRRRPVRAGEPAQERRLQDRQLARRRRPDRDEEEHRGAGADRPVRGAARGRRGTGQRPGDRDGDQPQLQQRRLGQSPSRPTPTNARPASRRTTRTPHCR